MRKRIALISAAVITVMEAACLGVTASLFSKSSLSSVKEEAYSYASLYASSEDPASVPSLEGVKVAFLNDDLEPVYEVGDLPEEYYTLPEVEEAVASSEGIGSRGDGISSSTGICCLKVDSGSFSYVYVEAANPAFGTDFAWFCLYSGIVFVVVLAAGVALSLYLHSLSIKPIKLSHLRFNELANGATELTPFPKTNWARANRYYEAVDVASRQLIDAKKTMQEEKEGIRKVLDSVSDPIIIVEYNLKLGFINEAGASAFHLDPNKEHTLFDLGLEEKVEGKIKRYDPVESLISIAGKHYALRGYKASIGYVLCLADITFEVNGEKLRSNFFSSASHELKTPLTSILGQAEILSLKNKDESLDQPIASISTSGKRMLRLIQDMLSLSRIESGAKKVEGPIELSEVAEEVKKELLPLAGQTGAEVTIEGKLCYPINRSDAYAVIKNLVENGIRYGKPNGHVKVCFLEDGFYVEDDGIGISEDDQQHIFERFYRTDKAHSYESGTGLGLAIVKHVMLNYGGKVSVSSRLGEGSRFTCTFPLAK